jgi:ribose transport system ATP-binding protein
MVEPLVRMRGIGKRFGSARVLEGVDLDIHPGEVLVLAGENGAGKSTLIKILGGVHADYEGTLEIQGQIARPQSPLEAAALGISVIFQELSLVPSMTVTDNIFLGRPVARGGWIDDRAQRLEARKLLGRLGLEIDVRRRVDELSISQQQQVEIAKALARHTRVVVMDEPTSALSAPEVDQLFGLITDLKARQCGVVYITHRMEEIERVADRITVLRDGRHVATTIAAGLEPARLIRWMVGRDLADQFPRNAPHPGPVRLRLHGFSVPARRRDQPAPVDRVTLSVHAGEIVGVAGLQGSGNSELFLALFGVRGSQVSGQVHLREQPFRVRSPRHSIEQGMALLTNDRKATGLVLSLSVTANATLADLPRLSPWGWRRPRRENAVARSLGERLHLRAPSLDLEVETLSGGNQQKVALGKWLQTDPQVLLLDEPTRGIDVAAKREIYQLLNQLTAQGLAILLITSELPELLALSDRLVVLHRGRVTAEFDRLEATPEKVLEAAMGGLTPPGARGGCPAGAAP